MKKGFIAEALTSIVLGAGIAIISVLIFFYVFKVHVDLQMREQYIWNKVQEVPLDLLSTNLENEPFVSKMNKVYYNFEPKSELDKVKNLVNRQLYYFFSSIPQSMGYVIQIGDITVSRKEFPNCECKGKYVGAPTLIYYCTAQCPKGSSQPCGKPYAYGEKADINRCYDIGRIEYHGEYPFPLTFNGTDKLIDSLSYDAVEYK